MQYIIEKYIHHDEVYKACSPKEVRGWFKYWKDELFHSENKAIKKYRRKTWLGNNINAKLRNGENPLDAEIISEALHKATVPHNIIVFRRLDKRENKIVSELDINDRYCCKDFKGTHVGEKIINFWKSGGYMFVLIPRGTNGAYINNFTLCYWWEKEFLIDKGQCFVLLEKEQIFGKDSYIFKLINKDS